ncbi:hypothetical protein FXE78_13120 [Vibrio mimicus]|nr:hypothetical protein FXE78_13120 [Vibrio mimicus]
MNVLTRVSVSKSNSAFRTKDLTNSYVSVASIFHFLLRSNARLRGWQRINTKLKHNNRNHHGSLGLETPSVDSPS